MFERENRVFPGWMSNVFGQPMIIESDGSSRPFKMQHEYKIPTRVYDSSSMQEAQAKEQLLQHPSRLGNPHCTEGTAPRAKLDSGSQLPFHSGQRARCSRIPSLLFVSDPLATALALIIAIYQLFLKEMRGQGHQIKK